MGDKIYASAQRCPDAEFLGDGVLWWLVPQHAGSVSGCGCAVPAGQGGS